MAKLNASDRLMPFSMQPGRIDDFVNGMREGHDELTRAAIESVGIAFAPMAWSSFKKYMKSH